MATIRDDRPLSLYATCQPSGGIGGADARSTNATNIKRRAISPKSKLNRRPKEATRAPKVHASRANPADMPASKNPRPVTNPGNKPTRITARTRNPIALKPTPNHMRPLPGSIF